LRAGAGRPQLVMRRTHMARISPVRFVLAAALAALCLAGCQNKSRDDSADRTPGPPTDPLRSPSDGLLAINLPATQARGKLSVQSPAFPKGGVIPDGYSSYGQDVSPPLRWSEAPWGTQAIVVLLEDPDAQSPKPYVHWVLYNLPADTRELPAGLPKLGRLKDPRGALHGLNSRGSLGYFGPRPPAGDPPHRYHFQVFALDAPLGFNPGVNRQAVLNAMAGHVLAKGELVGTYQRSGTIEQ
jgi:Raf kinase inhibitor-like YbhB/YbcL family protein